MSVTPACNTEEEFVLQNKLPKRGRGGGGKNEVPSAEVTANLQKNQQQFKLKRQYVKDKFYMGT